LGTKFPQHYLSTCMSWSYVSTRFCTHNFGNANYLVGHIKRPRGPQVPHPWSRPTSFNISLKCVKLFLTKIIYCNTHTTINTEKARGPHVARGPAVGPRCYRRMSATDSSEWWAFSFYGVENWLLLRIICGTKRLNLFLKLHEASEVLNKYVVGVWSDNFTAAFFVSFSFNVTEFPRYQQQKQSKVMFMNRNNNLFSQCNEHV